MEVLSSPHTLHLTDLLELDKLVHVERLKDTGLSLSLSDPLSAANVLEIFLNNLLSSAKSLFYLCSSLIPIPSK